MCRQTNPSFPTHTTRARQLFTSTTRLLKQQCSSGPARSSTTLNRRGPETATAATRRFVPALHPHKIKSSQNFTEPARLNATTAHVQHGKQPSVLPTRAAQTEQDDSSNASGSKRLRPKPMEDAGQSEDSSPINGAAATVHADTKNTRDTKA